MFKLILRNQNLFKITTTKFKPTIKVNFQLIKKCSTNSKFKDEFFVPFKPIQFESESEYEIEFEEKLNEKENKKFDENELINKAYQCLNLKELLDLINPKIKKLDSYELNKIYDRIINLWFLSKRENLSEGYLKFNKEILESSTFKSLIQYTETKLEELNSKGLCNLLIVFGLIKFDPNTKIVNSLFKLITDRINEFDLNLINICMFGINFYKGESSFESKLSLNKFENNFSRIVKDKIWNEIDERDLNLMIDFINNFSNQINYKDHFEIISYLVKLLNSNENQLNFMQSVKLLKSIKTIKFIYDKYKLEELPAEFISLIEACNRKILLNLLVDENEFNFNYYLSKMHNGSDSGKIVLKQLYDEKILNLLSKFIISRSEEINKFYIYNLVFNYSRFYIFNEELLKLIYNLVINDLEFRSKLNFFQTYFLFSKLNLPFVNYKKLAKIVFDFSSPNVKKDLTKQTNSIRVLNDIILADVDDENLILQLIELIKNLNSKTISKIPSLQFRDILKSKAYLLVCNKEMDENLKIKIIQCLNYVIKEFLKHNEGPRLINFFSNFNDKLIGNCFLSNELYIDHVTAIYDKSIYNFISLNKFKDYRFKMDKIPLKKNQKINILIERMPIKGEISNYESYSNYKLKKILNEYKKIEIIDVSYLFD